MSSTRKNARAKACDISRKTRKEVADRDEGVCILCEQNNGFPNAHFISRAHGGLGIPENIGTLCLGCHYEYDHGTREHREELRNKFRCHLQGHYPEWNEDKLIYRKWG